ncbi:MAG: DUF364 domain-containing protein [Candidatus Muirbacterium halophilum]|nr:DUF364 domain-containing protein [Candidatus Muirbacterium halophilum]MCK9476718.1 DUF364 domain-containing protein [Candidatus Muirbacterium halophilum]
MNIYKRLYEKYRKDAEKSIIESIVVGVGYCFVKLTDGRSGIAYSYFEYKKGCTFFGDNTDFEGLAAINLLKFLENTNTLVKSLGFACLNALNDANLTSQENGDIVNFLDLNPSSEIFMIGFFGPIVNFIKKAGVKSISILDKSKKVGDSDDFYAEFANAENPVLLLTSTSLLNDTFHGILEKIPKNTKICMVGPSTVMDTEIMKEYGINVLSGMKVIDAEGVQKAIKLGGGTPIIKEYCSKLTIKVV